MSWKENSVLIKSRRSELSACRRLAPASPLRNSRIFVQTRRILLLALVAVASLAGSPSITHASSNTLQWQTASDWTWTTYNGLVAWNIKMSYQYNGATASVQSFSEAFEGYVPVYSPWEGCSPATNTTQIACGVDFAYYNLDELSWICIKMRDYGYPGGGFKRIPWQYGAPSPQDKYSCFT